MKLFEQTLA
ncbi:uncharacterized protein DNG_03972 [Cephalotrichum gorgonifer]|uniref:Uncharacterized protein n=1 Tax=Cephalotrichum gorgonifer TaxID=2041049 RepID=A0AAE8MXW4_9PEZI|nr:uncharacterized protein DNG_03972 [Cephalotrichum gorgonifer]